jgi:hypothetical protein
MICDMSCMHCGECGIEFHVPAHFYKERQETGRGWFCPNGHSRVFREKESDKLRRERDRLAQQIAEKNDEIKRQREMREAAERKASAARGQVTKMRNRVGNGVCPCCTRSFTNLQRHMETQHPEFKAEAAE